ncbi:MAG: DAK2 domain-containing protein [Bacillota bacterium]
MQLEVINGSLLKQLISAGTACLFAHKAEVDSLNVFPVPDGDTGTNMYLTFQSASREANQNTSDNIFDILESAAYGALMGARGNSGVIVSQFFRGFVKALPHGAESLSKLELEKGLNGASLLCFQAVRQPVEGTILTVIKEIAKYASENLTKETTLPEYINYIYQHANQVLAKTPDMLPVLKKAGVVDAGAQGLVYFLKGISLRINGEEFEVLPEETPSAGKITAVSPYTDEDLLPEEITFQYCTEFILKGKQLDLENIKNSLNPYGDCMLVVGDQNNAKIHIHTNNPGIILDFAVRLGDLSEIQIHNMVEQSQKRLAQKMIDDNANRRIGIVAVTSGDGLERIFRSLGVQVIVNGGQTMNPSIEELTKAVSVIPSSKILILPNNSNIILTANHVQELLPKKQIQVVPTQSIPEGLAAMMIFTDEHSLEENAERMTEKSSTLITGEVTYAVRSFQFNDQEIRQGDIIGLVNGEIVTFGDTPEKVVEQLLKTIPEANSGLISIYYGNDIVAATAQELLNKLEQSFSQAEIELYYGGQPLYYYLISVE